MSGETETPIPEAETDADFQAGFSGGATETPAPAVPVPEAVPQPEATPVAEETPAPQEFVQLTKADHERLMTAAQKLDELTGTVTQQFKTAFGHVGALKQMVHKLQGETPQGQPVALDEADFAELKEQYPEIAELSLKGLNKVFEKFKGTANGAELSEKISSGLRGDFAKVALEVAFPDWEEDVKKPEFSAWVQTQPEDVKALARSDKESDAAKMLRRYYRSVETPAPAAVPAAPTPTPAPTPAPAGPTLRQRQLAAAVPLKGEGGTPPAPTEEDDFEAGFNRRRG